MLQAVEKKGGKQKYSYTAFNWVELTPMLNTNPE